MEKKTREEEINIETFGFTSSKYKANLQKIFSLKAISTKQDIIYFCLLISTIPDNEFRKIVNFSRITHRCWKVLKTVHPFKKLLENYTDKEVLNDYKNLMYLEVIKKYGPDLILRLYEEHYEKYENIKKISEVQNTLEKLIPFELDQPTTLIEKFNQEINRYSMPNITTEFVQIFSKHFFTPKIIVIEQKRPSIQITSVSKFFSYFNSKYVYKDLNYMNLIELNNKRNFLSRLFQTNNNKFNEVSDKLDSSLYNQQTFELDEDDNYIREFNYSI